MDTFLLHVAQIGVFVFSFRLFIGNLDESLAKRRIKPQLMTKIVTAYVLFCIFGALFAQYFVLIVFFVLVSGQVFIHFVQVLRNSRIEKAVLPLVQQIILNISAGYSFNQAYSRSVLSMKQSLQHPFKSIWDIQRLSEEVFPGERTYKLSLIIRQCRSNSSSSLELIKEFRRFLYVEESFLLKLRTNLSQIRTQLCFITVFYVGMLMVLVKLGLLSSYLGWVFASIILFIVGSLAVWFLPRSFKWLD